MTPDEYCQDRAAKTGSTSHYSFLFLPPVKRHAATALYAFCREVADVATSDPALSRIKLAWWRTEVASAYHGDPQHPVARALATAARNFNLPHEKLNEILSGREIDVMRERYADFASLKLYCERTMGIVGELSAEIFGYADRNSVAHARELGIAFQLTNIIRRIREDARQGKIYVPLDELERFGISISDVLACRETPRLSELIEFQIARAREFYASALAMLPVVDRRSQHPGLIRGAIYRALLREIERDGCHLLTHRIALTPLRKFWIAWKTWLVNR